ncbi:phosphodiesterase 12-like protein [Dinothrombium tinctorium]|uniref:2',5'-phosphodiesterase 12 n=1 Tax=Dinothrombium tinctorium TaxID=1965070 RepID=A0A3S3RUV3_9ACAR|nr:phosphodiesterase 12-like protein [Dinothrombium tinctorium]RWS06360.1 phosphodiesterase 12-like protein [Dinothrombium tinctorium]
MLSSNTLTVRLLENDESVYFNFYYKLNANDRLYTFKRSKEEALHFWFNRIRMKISEKIERKKKKKQQKLSEQNDSNEVENINIYLKYNNTIVDENLTHSQAWRDGLTFIVGESSYNVVVNAPAVTTLKLPKIIMAGFKIYPTLAVEFCKINECKFSWFRKRLPHEKLLKSPLDSENKEKSGFGGWFLVGNEYWYEPTKEDIGRVIKLRCLPARGDLEGVEAVAESSGVVTEGPEFCPFERRHEFTQKITERGTVRCVSYNILADLYADSDYSRTVLFPYCPPEILDKNYRRNLLFKELTGYNGDVVCLQEVDRKLYNNELKEIMDINGLDSVYSEKKFEDDEKFCGEGLACFYRRSKFKLLQASSMNLSEELESNSIFMELKSQLKQNENFYKRLMKRKTILQYSLLQSLEDERKMLLVGNTHLYFAPDADHIRLVQSTIMIKIMEHLLSIYKIKYSDLNISPIIFGDFNSCPEFGVFKLITTGKIESSCEDWKSNAEETLSDISVSHSLSLASACGTPKYTNYTTEFSGCLDYIFYDRLRLSVTENVPLPSDEEVKKYVALPNKIFPSDHLPLICSLRWNEFG